MKVELERFVHSLVRIVKGKNKPLHPAVRRRILASVLSLCMVLSLFPVTTFAAKSEQGTSVLCNHHTEHTAECGYIEDVEGAPCEFISDEPEETSEFLPDEPKEASASNADKPTASEEEQTPHTHDKECGYIEAVKGEPCGFVCEVCNEMEDDSAVEESTADEPTVDEPTCICTESCSEDAVNEECAICAEDIKACIAPIALQTALLASEAAISVRFLRCERPDKDPFFTPVKDWQEGSGTSLENVVRTLVPDFDVNSNTLSELVVTDGTMTAADWDFLLVYGSSALKKLTFDPDVVVAPSSQIPGFGMNLKNLEEISYPQATEIGEKQFQVFSDPEGTLKKVDMPNVTKIGAYAFDTRPGLTEMSFPLVTELGKWAFHYTGMTSVSFPEVTEIPLNCFDSCYELETASFPKAVTIKNFAFQSCSNLQTLEIGSVKSIEKYAFIDQQSLKYLKLPATPPTGSFSFGGDKCKYITLVDQDGKDLEGKALNTAIDAYLAQKEYVKQVSDPNEASWKGMAWRDCLLPEKVELIAVDSVTLNKNSLILTAGGTETLTAAVTPDDAADKTITWSSDNPAVATVDANGLVTAVSAGTATVTATALDGEKNDSCTVTVKNASYTLTANAAKGGSITPSGNVSVVSGGNQIFTITPDRSYSISAVTVDGIDVGAVSSYTFSNVTADHTISATFSYKSSDGGSSGSSGSSGGGGTVTTPKPQEKENPSKGQSTVTAPVDEKGNASVTVTDKNITDAIAQAKSGAAQNQPISVSIMVETDKAATQITATLPKTVQESLISNKVNSFTVASNTVTMSFGQTAIVQMNDQAKSDITITAAKVDTGSLPGDAKALIGSRPMYDFAAVYGDNKTITSFGGNTVSIAIPYVLGNGETAGNIQAIYVDNNGTATPILNSGYDAGQKAVIFTTSHFSYYGVGYKQAGTVFTDIANHWAKSDIEFVTNRNLLTGTGNNLFSPNAAMTRGMFVTALGKMADVDISSYTSGSFTDVKADAYYAPYVNWAAGMGLTAGTTATTFSPDQTVTRQEMAVFMANYAKAAGYSVPKTRAAVTFADNSNIADWASGAVKSMQMAGVIMGKDGNLFDPTGAATRAEVSAVLRRYVELTIDPATAQGFDVNDSGKIVYYENGQMIAPVVTDAQTYATYVIVSGDNLWKIAAKYNCTPAKLMELNGISDPNNLLVGMELKIPQR